jgi:hypothetical protein
MQHMRSFTGYREVLELGGYQENPDAEWDVLYRCAEENGEAICPQIMTIERLRKMQKDKPWTYYTQYQNLPQSSTAVEFSAFKPKSFYLDSKLVSPVGYGRIPDKYVYSINYRRNTTDLSLPLTNMDVVGAVDPAATEKYMTAKTSRTALAVVAEDAYQEKYLLELVAGYFTVYEFIGHMLRLTTRFQGLIRTWCIEAQGFQRMLKEVINREKRLADVYFHVTPVPAIGDKAARIRTSVGPELQGNRIWVNEKAESIDVLRHELQIFPQNKFRMDCLDAITHGLKGLTTPLSSEDEAEILEADEDYEYQTTNATGY